MEIEIERILLPVAMLTFFLAGLVLPIVRFRRRNGTNPVAFGRTRDPRQRAMGVVMALALGSLAALTIAHALRGPEAILALALPPWLRTAGWLIAIAGLAVLVTGQAHMGRSFRIGIDVDPTSLVTSGLFRFVRHPIYAGMLTALAGVSLAVASPLFAALWAVVTLVIHVEVTMEERHLAAQHGAAYDVYRSRVGRLLPRLLPRL